MSGYAGHTRLLLALGLGGCFYDPHAELAGVDLHVVVLRLDSQTAEVEVSARAEAPAEATSLTRTLAPDTDGRAEVFVPRLPQGRFVVRARARSASGETLTCATLRRTLDAAAAPHDVTLDMVADAAPCADVPDAGTGPDADGAPDARRPPGQEGRPDAGADDDRRGPPERDMRLRKDANEAGGGSR
jgi:hypothetical protein